MQTENDCKQSQKRIKLVLAGGPGVGKTTVIEKLKQKLVDNDSINTIIIDEVASILLKDRSEYIKPHLPDDRITFQFIVYRVQRYIEETLERSIKNNKPCLLIFDRGLPDIYAYINDPQDVKEKVGITDIHELKEYDYVLILEGKHGETPSHSLEDRIEDLDGAQLLRERTNKVWSYLYPDKAKVIPYFDDPNEKSDYVASVINEIVGTTVFVTDKALTKEDDHE